MIQIKNRNQIRILRRNSQNVRYIKKKIQKKLQMVKNSNGCFYLCKNAAKILSNTSRIERDKGDPSNLKK